MGAGIAASPHCAERRICRCSQPGPLKPEGPAVPALDPGSPAQASPSTEPLPLARSPSNLLDCAARRFAGLSTVPARHSGTEVPRSQNRSVFRGPSWVDHSRVPLCSPHRNASSRVALEEDRLFRRLFPAGPGKNPKALPTACRRRSDLWSPAAPACRCRLLGRPGPPSRSPKHNAPLARVAEAKNAHSSLWITWISGTTTGISGNTARGLTTKASSCPTVLSRRLGQSP